jgi:NADH-quinone oxidoreductase subunit D
MKQVINVGPYNPVLKEPEYLQVFVEDGKITDARINLGYNHRGIEKLLEDLNFRQAIPLVERVCGFCGVVHSTTYCQNVEALLGITAPPRAQYIRTILLEFERIQSHTLWAGLMAERIHHEGLFKMLWRDREMILDLIESIAGNRIHYSMNAIGGARRDISNEDCRRIIETLGEFDKMCKYHTGLLEKHKDKLKGVGIIDKKEAEKWRVVGPVARASGIKYDVRKDLPYAAYPELDFEVITAKEGDSHARTAVRLAEICESMTIILQAVRNMPEGPIIEKIPLKIPAGEVCGLLEAPRGENFHYLMSDGGEKIRRIRIRPPTYANLQALGDMLEGCRMDELPAAVLSLDPCFACVDRVMVVDNKTGEKSWLKK